MKIFIPHNSLLLKIISFDDYIIPLYKIFAKNGCFGTMIGSSQLLM